MVFVPYADRHGYILNGVPKPHMRRLWKQSRKQNTSFTNVVGRILAERYSLVFSPSPRKAPPPDNGDRSSLSLRLPDDIFAAVEAEAVERNVTMRSVILDAMSDSFRLKAPEPTLVPGRRPGRPRKD